MPKLSVILPVFNGELFLSNTINNILSQSFCDYELIAVNDGSSDDSKEILDHFKQLDSRIIVIHKKNEGICKTRNVGLSLAKGEYVIFIDQDDTFDSSMFQDGIMSIEDGGFDLCVFGSKYTVYGESGYKDFNLVADKQLEVRKKEEIYDIVFNTNNGKYLLTIWNCIFRNEIIIKNNIHFFENLKYGNEDTLFNMVYASKCDSIKIVPRIHYHYSLRHGGSTYSKYNPNVMEDTIFIAKVANSLISNTESNDYMDKCFFFIFRMISRPYLHITKHSNLSYKDKKCLVKNILSIPLFTKSVRCNFSNFNIGKTEYYFYRLLQIACINKFYLGIILLFLIIKKIKGGIV